MLAFAAMMAGSYEDALHVARDLEADMPEDVLRDFVMFTGGLMPTTFHVMGRFGNREDILKEPDNPDFRVFSNAVRHYARSVAYSATGCHANARKELEAFETLLNVRLEEWRTFTNSVHDVRSSSTSSYFCAPSFANQ